jgi:hypothetical protein
MNFDQSVAERLTFLGQSLARGVAAACILLAVVALFMPNSFIPEPGVVASVPPTTYLIGEGDARGVFIFQGVLIAFHWAIGRNVELNRLGFVTVATILTLTTFARQYVLELNPGILGEWFPWSYDLAMGSIYVPVAALFSIALVLWNVGLLMSKDKTQNRERTADEQSLTEWLDQHRWLVVARFSGYTLVAACVVAGIAGVVNLPLVPEVWDRTTPMFLLFAAAVYGFVSSDYALGTATVAVGAWITGLAALQYDSATSGVVLPMAVLLTISAAGMVFEDSRLRRNSAETEASPEEF